MTRRAQRAFSALVSACALAAAAAPFTPGNVIVYRIGAGGAAALSANGNPVFLDEYDRNGAFVQSVALPSVASGANKALVGSGTAGSDGHLTRSVDGSCLVLPGYSRDLGTGAGNLVSGTVAGGGAIPRVVGRVLSSGAIDTSTALTDFAVASNPRGAATVDCNNVWASGGAGGVRYAAIGSTTSTDLTSGTFANLRAIGIADGQLYVSGSVTALRGVATVGTGLPTSGAQTVTRLPGLTDAQNPGTYAFFFADLDGTPGADTLYVADDLAGALTKYSLVGGSWVHNGTVGVDADDYRGLTGSVAGTTVTLYATRQAPSSQLVALVDASGFNGTLAGTPTVIATAATNTVFRGVAMAPYLTVTPSAGANGTISPNTPTQVGGNTSAVFTVTPDAGYTALVGGTCGGNLVGNTYTTNPVAANCTVVATFTLQQTYTITPSAGANGSISPNTPQSVLPGDTKQFTVTPNGGYAASVGGTCGGNLVGNTYTTNAVNQDCTVEATFTLVTYTVTPSAGANGSISPDTPQIVPQGQGTSFTVTPNSGYSASVGGTCGGTLTGTNYVTNAITADCTVEASFSPLPTYTVTPSAGAHGSISPDTPQFLTQGQTTTFTVIADAGYTAVVRGTCGGTLSGTTFTTNAVTANCTVAATFTTKLVLFVGNSYTFGRIDPVMSYNAANVTDLTHAMWLANPTGSNEDEPHPWGGIPGVFKKLTDQAGLGYDVSISARNAASLRGHYLNSNPAGWDLRGNVASQKWDVVVLQELSDGALPPGRGANANLAYFNAYTDKLEAWIHSGAAETYTESQLFGGSTAACMAATGGTASACDTVRVITPANANASAATDVYLYQTWARPDMIAPNGTNANGHFYTAAEGLEKMTQDLHDSYFGRAVANANFKAVNPVGDAFLRAVQAGFAMRDPYVPEAGKINLWYIDYFHPSKHGSYLSALVHFAMITGLDPTTFGSGEQAAADLGITPAEAEDLQLIAKISVAPAAPAIGTAVAGNGQVSVAFTPPANVGGLPILGYTATCNGQSASGMSSPIVVPGLANGVAVTCTVTARNSVATGAASAPSNSVTPASSITPQVYGDFNANGTADLVFQNADGRVAAWLMNGTSTAATANLIGAGTGWSVTHLADLDGDRKADILFQHTDGRVYAYRMDGLTVAGGRELLGAGLGWSVSHTADLNGDGKTDLVLRHTDGRAHLWLMDGTTVIGGGSLLPAGSGWNAVATGDVNGDGKADIVFAHDDGRGYLYLMNGATVIGGTGFLAPGSGWTVSHTGDFNGDGKADLLFRHTDGRAFLYLMNGATFGAGASVLDAGTGWTVSHVGDMDGDGRADIVFRHADGRAHVRLMNGTAIANAGDILPAGSGWRVTQLLDLNGDGKKDIVFRHDDGRITVRLMNGLATTASGNLLGAGAWSVVP
jgi:hypothetical protein